MKNGVALTADLDVRGANGRERRVIG